MVDPEGAGKAPLLIVGGTRESRGVVCSASYEARKFGVRSAMPISRALRLCPNAMCVPVPRRACGEKSREIRAVLERYRARSSKARASTSGTWTSAAPRAVRARAARRDGARACATRVAAETELSVSIGGGTTKLVAKLAVERAKPKPGTGATGVHIVAPGDEGAFLETFELAEIPMIGPRFQERLARLGMRRVPDVLQYDAATLDAVARRARGASGCSIASAASTHSEVEAARRREEHQSRRDVSRRHQRRRRARARAARARDARRRRSSRRRHDGAHDHRSDSRSRLQDAAGEPHARARR